MADELSAEELNAALDEAVGLHEAGQIDAATARYDAILVSAPDNPDALYLRGTLAAQQEDHDTAEALLSRALEAAPRVPAVHNNLGIVMRARGRWDDAAARFRRALVLNPRYPEALANLGATLYSQGAIDEAVAAYRKALEIQPVFSQALFELGSIAFERQDFDEAADLLRRTAQADPENRGYAASCVIGDPFAPMTDPARLDTMLGDLPAVEGGFPDTAEGNGPVVMVACDHAYFAQFGKALALSLNQNAPGMRVHLHIFDPVPEIETEIEQLRTQLGNTSLTATWEGTRGAGPAYFASIRFVRLFQLYDSSASDVLSLDADSLVLRDLGAVSKIAGDADLAAWTRLEVPELQNKIWASAMLVRQSEGGRRFLSRLAAYLAVSALEGKLAWWLDQCAIYITWKMLEFMGQPVSLASLPDSMQDKTFDPASVIWTASGNGKADETFILAKDRILRGEAI